MHGWNGKVLRVDLTRGKVSAEALDPRTARDYIGGRGLGIHYLNREVDPACDPFSPENLLVMATGPLTGTRAPTGARYMVMTKSPLTGAITCSNSGGHFPTELKRTGYDALLFEGAAPEPVYLRLDGERAELRPAAHLWGTTTHEATDRLLAETDPKARVCCIGPAGERRVLFAAVLNDNHRAAGRSGVGAVMGSKNLKAVVARGDRSVALADEEGFREVNARVLDRFQEAAKKNPPALRLHGTAVTVMATQNYGVLPTKNWQHGTFEGWKKIHGETLTERFLVKASACFSCPIACGRRTRVDVPGFEGEGEGPEYETLYAMGSNCLIDDLAAVTKANYLCNELGLDTITMGATVACAMELVERGHLSEEVVGLPLRWGDGGALVELTRQTGLREGFGDRLAEGSLRLATACGHPELAMHSKGQEFAGYEPRGSQAMGLAYATSPIGASHMRGDPAYWELLGVPRNIDRFAHEGKGPIVRDWQDLFAIIDSAGLCVFFSVRNLIEPQLDCPPTDILAYLNAATGAGYTLEELVRAGERITNAERLFLVRAGFRRKDDSLPARLTETPLPDGPAEGRVCRLDEMLDDYYRARGWDADGVPTAEKLDSLGLGQGA
ncbi:MAG: aldehyde ferredoxin oxidoreductase family protein [Deltaproteobacteria bacterium]|nr:aldehyde ferredoxin oxidoreductase family protein [Deltaproteobacteria bacterium]